MTSSEFDVVILGDGLVGLACARAIARRGLTTCLVGRRRPGIASVAAAGFLAPTVEPARGRALAFTIAARDRYPSFIAELREETGRDVPFALDGVLRVAASEREAASLARSAGESVRFLSSGEVAELEPALDAPHGACLHAHDGMVDNQRLLQLLEAAVGAAGSGRQQAQATRVELHSARIVVRLDDGREVSAQRLVVAAGAWSGSIPGLPRPLPIRPLRGQMMSLAAGTAPSPGLQRPAFGHGGYLVPRPTDREIFVGSTAESVGFTVGTTDAALAAFRHTAARLVPALARADEVRTWSGFRPMTLDGLPIIGEDPQVPRVVYACGHSRNGILLAPLTGDVVSALITGSPMEHDLTPFAMTRFSSATAANS